MALPQKDNYIDEFKKTDALLEYAVMHGDKEEAEQALGISGWKHKKNLKDMAYYYVFRLYDELVQKIQGGPQ